LALTKGDPAVSTASDSAWMNLMDFNLYGDPAAGLFPGPVLQVSPAAIAFTAAEGEEGPLSAALALTSGDVSVAVQAGADTPWLDSAPAEVRTPATLSLGVLPAGLAVGTHAAQVLLTSAAANTPLAVPVTLTVTRAGSIEGRLSDAAGKPIPGAIVTLRGRRSRQTATDADGNYGFAPLPPGRYAVEVSGTGFVWRRAAKDCLLAEGERQTVNFFAVSYAIRGRVTDTAGRPIPKVAVRLFDASGVLLRQAVTNANGAYVIGRLGPGRYELRARRRPWRFQPVPLAARITDVSLASRNFVGRR
ncbi:MAG TPA: carboxypeptidase-like regulatory domain-containing protein, partial [Candidatus Methanoperedens sp.]|nr:carboxypeptidase-like regulatory domain-containing protein [Candidatus Methanoperedens sp.]